MEIASYLIDKASSITVIGSSELPYQNTLGSEIGRAIMKVRERVMSSQNFSSQVCCLWFIELCCSCRYC